jgi:hypothetical protein
MAKVLSAIASPFLSPPENMSHDELQQTMQQQNIQAQPVTQEDQQAMASAEATDTQSGAES